MPEYDFKSLSSYDFALVSRDLLQTRLGVQLECFSAGPDSGIDFREKRGSSNLIVQSKHYADSGFNTLLSLLKRKELPKIRKLQPSRYILATSVPLTPWRKDKIEAALSPYCLESGDIYGKEDLNNLLGQQPDVERKHFKLWLTSAAVLHRVLNAGIFSDSESHLANIRARLSRYVPNASFHRARALLEKAHHCVIAGIPGIGKTTLAEVLLADLVDRHGFEVFRIANNLGELRSVKNTKRRQVFYFDDFLGRTTLDKLDKNEDQRLVELMDEVASNANWRFILTTREYILNTARLQYEAFAQPRVDFQLCIVMLDEYTRPIRAKILYNHIYFSKLSKGHKLALLQDRGYESILTHRNYNPRVIEYMTDARRAATIAPALYLSEFNNSLENPARIWDHAFRYQISEAARHVLLVLSTLPAETLLADLEKAFWVFYRYRQKKFGFATRSSDFNNALKQLDGNFIATRHLGKEIVVSFSSPSVADYLQGFLFDSEPDITDLCNATEFYEQFVALWKGRGGQRYPGVDHNREAFLGRLESYLFCASASTIHVANKGKTIGIRHHIVSNEARVQFALGVTTALGTSDDTEALRPILNALEPQWEEGLADKEALVRLLKALTEKGLKNQDRAFLAARKCLQSTFDSIDEFRAFVQFIAEYEEEVSASDLERVKSEFGSFAPDYASDARGDDPDWIRQVASDLEYVADRLGMDMSALAGELYAQADEIEAENAEPERDHGDEGWGESMPPVDNVHEMFDELRSELQE